MLYQMSYEVTRIRECRTESLELSGSAFPLAPIR